MVRELKLNVSSIRKFISSDPFPSKWGVSDYIFLWLIYRKEYATIEDIFGVGDMDEEYLSDLERNGWIKITGPNLPYDVSVRQKFIDCLLAPDREKIEGETAVSRWIDIYRNLFKGRRAGAMGDRALCIENMQEFLEVHPEVTKDQIMVAAKYYIQTQGPSYQYLQQADYFIYKKEGSIRKSKLWSILEDLKDSSVAIAADFTTEI